MIKMETFEQRLNAQEHLSLFEFMYPTLQGYDFLHLYKTLGLPPADGRRRPVDQHPLRRRAGGSQPAASTVYAMTFRLLLDASRAKDGQDGGRGGHLAERRAHDAFRLLPVLGQHAPTPTCGGCSGCLPFSRWTRSTQIVRGDPRAAQHRLAYEVTKIVHGEEAARTAQADAQQALWRWRRAAGGCADAERYRRRSCRPGVSLMDVIARARRMSAPRARRAG